MKYLVKYSEHQCRCITVEADTAEEAERMVMDGDVDYEDSVEEKQRRANALKWEEKRKADELARLEQQATP